MTEMKYVASFEDVKDAYVYLCDRTGSGTALTNGDWDGKYGPNIDAYGSFYLGSSHFDGHGNYSYDSGNGHIKRDPDGMWQVFIPSAMAKYALKWLQYCADSYYVAPYARVRVFPEKGWQGRISGLVACQRGYHFPVNTLWRTGTLVTSIDSWRPGNGEYHLWLIEVDTIGMKRDRWNGKAVAEDIRYIEMIGKPTTPSGIRRAVNRAFAKYGEENFIV